MSDTTTTEQGMTCPQGNCSGTLEASTRVYLDVVAAHMDGETVVLDDLAFAHLNDQLDGQPCNVESEFDLTCTEGHQFDWTFGEGLRARIGAQPIGDAERTLGDRGGLDDRYRIDAQLRPDHAEPGRNTAHWSTMAEPGEALADILDDMAAMVRCSRGEATDADFDRLEIGENRQDFLDGPTMQQDCAYDVLDAWTLEISTARWVGHDGTPGDVARVEIVLGTGGPHVEAEIVCGKGGGPERVALHRHWSQSDQAETTDPRALMVAADWLDAFVVVE